LFELNLEKGVVHIHAQTIEQYDSASASGDAGAGARASASVGGRGGGRRGGRGGRLAALLGL
jgi:hypothetical protein